MKHEFTMDIKLAQEIVITPPLGSGDAEPFVIKGPLKGIENIGDLISKVLLILYPIAGLLLFIYLVYGGYRLLFSKGEPEKIQQARATITYAIFGFALLFISYLAVKIIVMLFGFGEGIF